MEKYIVDKTIGTGAFGNAILVKDKRSGQQYVVKTILISKVIFKETFIEYKVTKIYSHL
jgi:serine/threonine protein kinase